MATEPVFAALACYPRPTLSEVFSRYLALAKPAVNFLIAAAAAAAFRSGSSAFVWDFPMAAVREYGSGDTPRGKRSRRLQPRAPSTRMEVRIASGMETAMITVLRRCGRSLWLPATNTGLGKSCRPYVAS